MIDQVEEIGYGIQRRYLEDGRILEIKTEGNMARAAIDAWAAAFQDAIRRWPAGQNIFVISDLSHKNQGMSPYARKKANEIYALMPSNVQAFVATILPNTIVFRVISLFIYQRREQYIQHRLFLNRDEGLLWLKEMMVKHGEGSH
jgi:hypothetical protein